MRKKKFQITKHLFIKLLLFSQLKTQCRKYTQFIALTELLAVMLGRQRKHDLEYK